MDVIIPQTMGAAIGFLTSEPIPLSHKIGARLSYLGRPASIPITSTFRSTQLDASVAHMGLEVIKTPVRSPQANSLCERLIGTLRRECLDWIIPLSEQHLRKTLCAWLAHYNRGRPHSSLGPATRGTSMNTDAAGAGNRRRSRLASARPSCGNGFLPCDAPDSTV